MIDNIKKTIQYETIIYLIFGVITSVVNYVSFYIVIRLLGDNFHIFANIISFIIATTVAYLTNKSFVFKSKNWEINIIKKEIIAFCSTRIVSFFIETFGLVICVDVLNSGNYYFYGVSGVMISKILLSLIVVIINYFFSKYFIFKKK